MTSTSAPRFRGLAITLALLVGIAAAGNASALSKKDKHTIAGAVVGGIAGHMLSNGDPAATVGGAVAGGAIGNLSTSHGNDRRHDRYDRRDYRSSQHDRGHDRRWQRDRHYGNRHHGRGHSQRQRNHGR